MISRPFLVAAATAVVVVVSTATPVMAFSSYLDSIASNKNNDPMDDKNSKPSNPVSGPPDSTESDGLSDSNLPKPQSGFPTSWSPISSGSGQKPQVKKAWSPFGSTGPSTNDATSNGDEPSNEINGSTTTGNKGANDVSSSSNVPKPKSGFPTSWSPPSSSETETKSDANDEDVSSESNLPKSQWGGPGPAKTQASTIEQKQSGFPTAWSPTTSSSDNESKSDDKEEDVSSESNLPKSQWGGPSSWSPAKTQASTIEQKQSGFPTSWSPTTSSSDNESKSDDKDEVVSSESNLPKPQWGGQTSWSPTKTTASTNEQKQTGFPTSWSPTASSSGNESKSDEKDEDVSSESNLPKPQWGGQTSWSPTKTTASTKEQKQTGFPTSWSPTTSSSEPKQSGFPTSWSPATSSSKREESQQPTSNSWGPGGSTEKATKEVNDSQDWSTKSSVDKKTSDISGDSAAVSSSKPKEDDVASVSNLPESQSGVPTSWSTTRTSFSTSEPKQSGGFPTAWSPTNLASEPKQPGFPTTWSPTNSASSATTDKNKAESKSGGINGSSDNSMTESSESSFKPTAKDFSSDSNFPKPQSGFPTSWSPTRTSSSATEPKQSGFPTTWSPTASVSSATTDEIRSETNPWTLYGSTGSTAKGEDSTGEKWPAAKSTDDLASETRNGDKGISLPVSDEEGLSGNSDLPKPQSGFPTAWSPTTTSSSTSQPKQSSFPGTWSPTTASKGDDSKPDESKQEQIKQSWAPYGSAGVTGREVDNRNAWSTSNSQDSKSAEMNRQNGDADSYGSSVGASSKPQLGFRNTRSPTASSTPEPKSNQSQQQQVVKKLWAPYGSAGSEEKEVNDGKEWSSTTNEPNKINSGNGASPAFPTGSSGGSEKSSSVPQSGFPNTWSPTSSSSTESKYSQQQQKSSNEVNDRRKSVSEVENVSSQYLDYLKATEQASSGIQDPKGNAGSTDSKDYSKTSSSSADSGVKDSYAYSGFQSPKEKDIGNEPFASAAERRSSSNTRGDTRNFERLSVTVDLEATKSIPRFSSDSNIVAPNRLDAFLEKQMDALQSKREEIISDYGSLLKKHLRLALTGGVPLDREMAGERRAPDIDTKGMTERIMKSVVPENQAAGAGGASTWEAFQRAEANWARLKEYMPGVEDVPPPFVTEEGGKGNPKCFAKLLYQKEKSLDYDIAVCGGTLGIFFATALQLQGHKVCVVEAGKLRGREQEWNISMEELLHLKSLGVLSQDDIDAAIQTDFPGCRSGFKNKEVEVKGGYLDNGVGYECFTEGVLNLGVSPKILIERVAKRFESLGGVIKEESRLNGVCSIKEVGAALDFGEYEEPVTAHLVIDAMGNNSPITRQQRFGKKPDGICAVVGTCASGFDPKTNLNGDIIYTNTAIQDKGRQGGRMQYFWEAFPVGIGRNGKAPGTSDTKTTYMFTYMDAHQRRPTLESLMEDYWRLLPQYQPSIKNPELDLDVKRVLFAYFPTYRDSPLQPQFNRILAVGDASGIQSPLSFGGFGALTRHLGRITMAVTEALEGDLLTKEDLAKINPYTPNLSATWMFQKAMSIRVRQAFVDKRFINRLLATNFEVMNTMGPRTIKPFLQDVVRFDGLVGSLTKSFFADPTFMPQIVTWVGIPTLVEWMGHVGMMGAYTALDSFVSPWLRPIGNTALKKSRSKYDLNRQMDAWRYGSGKDYDISKLPKK
ncbi:hypothetical protein ACA910_016118 [Epithemia clementina (nom. ined.)]